MNPATPTPVELAITPYQIFVPLVALFFILYAWNHVFRGTKTIWEAILWTLFWGGVSVIALFPSWIGVLTAWTGIKGQANAVFAMTIGVLLFIAFHILVRLENIQRRITEVVRHEALRNVEENSKFQAPIRPRAHGREASGKQIPSTKWQTR